MKPCPRCTRDVQDDAAFCPACGAQLGAAPPAPSADPKPKPRMRWLHGLLAFIAFFFAPPLDSLLHRSPVLVGVAVVFAIALLVGILVGRRAGAHPALRAIGRHPAWSTYVAVLVLLAAMPKPPHPADPGSVSNSKAAAAGPSAPTPTAADAAQQQEQARHDAIAKAIATARRFEPGKKECGSITDVTDSWASLRKVKRSDAEFADAQRAAAQLEKCRLAWRNALQETAEQLMIAQREAWAKRLDTVFLDNGLNVKVSLSGRAKDRLQLTWPLMSRVTVHQLNKSGDLLEGATNVGFKRVTFADGFSESWYYDLKPEGEEVAEKVFADQGLGETMKL